MHGNWFGIEMMAKGHQNELLAEAARDRLAREVSRQTAGAYRERRPRPTIALGALLARLRAHSIAPRPTMTNEPAT